MHKQPKMKQSAYLFHKILLTCSRWISIRLEFIGVIIILTTCLFILLSRDTIEPGDAGLAITYALQITGFLNFLARQMSELEANIVSAERLAELNETPQVIVSEI